jgi:sphingosine kinase
MKIDVCSVTQGDKRYFAFMSLNYGVIADGDISTDHLRYLFIFRVSII